MWRSQSPPNTTPPAVASAAVLDGDAVRCVHRTLPERTSSARNCPRFPSDIGCLVFLRLTGPVPPPPSVRDTGPKVAVSQFRFIGMNSAFARGSNAIARQLLKPAVLGQKSSDLPTSGILPG